MEATKTNSVIIRVNDHRNSYRIKTNDGLKLELNKAEIGDFVPQKGMHVKLKLFNSIILQDVILDGKPIIRRSPQKLLEILAELTPQVRETSELQAQIDVLERSDEFRALPLAFRHRLKLLKTVLKNDFSPQKLLRQIYVCKVAAFLATQSEAYVAAFDSKQSKGLLQTDGLTDKELFDAKQLVFALRLDISNNFKNIMDYKKSETLNYKGLSLSYPYNAKDAIELYLQEIWLG